VRITLVNLMSQPQRHRNIETRVGDAVLEEDGAVKLAPLDPENCPMPEMLRNAFESKDPDTVKALDPILLEHRDFIYREHLELPIEL